MGDVRSAILKIEANRQLEINLHSATLMFAFECIHQLNINLRPIKGPVSWVYFPLLSKSVKCFLEIPFCFIPQINRTQMLLGTGGKGQRILKSKESINIVQELQAAHHFLLNLTLHAEQMRIVKRPLLARAAADSESYVKDGNLIIVTSSLPGEGKTFCSINLAMSISMEMDRTILLVDAEDGDARLTIFAIVI